MQDAFGQTEFLVAEIERHQQEDRQADIEIGQIIFQRKHAAGQKLLHVGGDVFVPFKL